MDHSQTDRLKTLLLVIALAGLVTGLGLQFSGRPDLAHTLWFAGVVPVREIDGRQIGTGARGPIVQRIQSLYKELVRRDIAARKALAGAAS